MHSSLMPRETILKELQAGLSLRPARAEDAAAIAQLVADTDLAEGSSPWVTEQDIRDDLTDPALHLETDTWVVEETGSLVAYGELWEASDPEAKAMDVQAWVAPSHLGRGIGSIMLDLSEGRALEAASSMGKTGALLRNFITARNETAARMLEARGYTVVRHFFHMGIELDPSLEPPPVPDGLTLRSLDRERDRHALFQLIDDAFRPSWGYTEMNFDEFDRRVFQRPDADHELTPVIFDGDDMVAASLNGTKVGKGWVEDLAVKETHRRRGLGELLLRDSFVRFRNKGWKKVGLGVDAANPTGAVRLYERVGMQIEREFVAYEKELSVG
jgi:mycothiol synthase